jgi:membrane protein
MLRAFAIPISWTELVKRTGREIVADNCLGLAAQLAYYFLLALVPAIVFFVALASLFPPSMLEQMMTALTRFAPGDVATIVRQQLASIAGGQKTGLLTFGLLMALWSSSAAIVSIVDALNSAYDIEEARPWWKVRLTAIGLTLSLAAFVLIAVGLVMVGPRLAEVIASQVGLGPAFEWAWKILQWPVVFILITVAIATLNYFAPDAEQDWTWVTPGAVLATALWLIASLGFKFYLANFADYNATYGSLGGVIVLMLWFYVSGLSILAGAEMNAEIEHASPYGKDPGEKVPGQKRKLGTAAARAYESRAKSKSRGTASPVPAPQPIPEPTASSAFAGGLVFFITRWFKRRANG